MAEYVSSVTQKGQVTIPAHIRRVLRIKAKDMVSFTLVDGEVRLRPIQSRLLAGYGAVKPTTKPIDFRKLRRETEEEIADEVLKEG